MSIARAVAEHIADDASGLGCKTMFATHYHELTDLEGKVEGVKNYNIAVKKRGEDVIFLRRIVRGPADDSYGIEVAKLAGLPDEVTHRARANFKRAGTVCAGTRRDSLGRCTACTSSKRRTSSRKSAFGQAGGLGC